MILGSSCASYSASICVYLRPSADHLVNDVGLLEEATKPPRINANLRKKRKTKDGQLANAVKRASVRQPDQTHDIVLAGLSAQINAAEVDPRRHNRALHINSIPQIRQ